MKACGVGETLQVWVKQGDGETLQVWVKQGDGETLQVWIKKGADVTLQDRVNNDNRENLKAIENRLLIKIFEK